MPRHQAEGDADEADGERDPGAIDDPREEIAPQHVGAHQIERPLARAEEMDVGRDDSQQQIGRAMDEELQRERLGLVGGIAALEGLHVQLLGDPIDHRRPLQPALDDEMRPLRCRQRMARLQLRIIGRHEAAEDHHEIEQPDHHEARQRQPMGAELPPHQPSRRRPPARWRSEPHVQAERTLTHSAPEDRARRAGCRRAARRRPSAWPAASRSCRPDTCPGSGARHRAAGPWSAD